MACVSCRSAAILVTLYASLIAGNPAQKADDLYILCQRPGQSEPVTVCLIGQEVCNQDSGQCEPASALQKLTTVTPWFQCHKDLQEGIKVSLSDACLHVQRILDAQSNEHIATTECDDKDDKRMFRLIVIVTNCSIGIVFLILVCCWSKGWICARDGHPRTKKLSSDESRRDIEILKPSSTVQNGLGTIFFLDNFKKSTNVCAVNSNSNTLDAVNVNDVVIKGLELEKPSHGRIDRNVNSGCGDGNC